MAPDSVAPREGSSVNEVKGKSKLGDNFFEEIGGRARIERVHDILYGKLFSHPWLKGYFAHTRREHVESQQNDFWAGLMGGPNVYGGRSPAHAHVHMFIPAQAYAVRHALLGDALEEAGVPAGLREKWLKLDAGFSPEECHGRFTTDPVIIVPLPDGLAA